MGRRLRSCSETRASLRQKQYTVHGTHNTGSISAAPKRAEKGSLSFLSSSSPSFAVRCRCLFGSFLRLLSIFTILRTTQRADRRPIKSEPSSAGAPHAPASSPCLTLREFLARERRGVRIEQRGGSQAQAPTCVGIAIRTCADAKYWVLSADCNQPEGQDCRSIMSTPPSVLLLCPACPHNISTNLLFVSVVLVLHSNKIK